MEEDFLPTENDLEEGDLEGFRVSRLPFLFTGVESDAAAMYIRVLQGPLRDHGWLVAGSFAKETRWRGYEKTNGRQSGRVRYHDETRRQRDSYFLPLGRKSQRRIAAERNDGPSVHLLDLMEGRTSIHLFLLDLMETRPPGTFGTNGLGRFPHPSLPNPAGMSMSVRLCSSPFLDSEKLKWDTRHVSLMRRGSFGFFSVHLPSSLELFEREITSFFTLKQSAIQIRDANVRFWE